MNAGWCPISKGYDVGRTIIGYLDRIYGFVICFKNKIDTLKHILNVLSEEKIHVIHISFSKPAFENEKTNILIFTRFKSENNNPRSLVKRLREIRNVNSVKVLRPLSKGLIVDTYHYPLMINELRAIILKEPVVKGLIKGIRERFGNAGEVLLFYIGYDIGLRAYDDHYSLSKTKKLKELVRINEIFFKVAGWGILKVLKYDPYKYLAKVRAQDLFECYVGKNSKKPYSQFTRGFLSGWFTRFFKEGCTAREIKCVAKGDPYCEFEIYSIREHLD